METSSPPSKQFRSVPPMKEVMVILFSDNMSILLVHFITRGLTVKAATYCDTLGQLWEAVCRKWPGLLWTGIMFLHYNAWPHSANYTCELYGSLGRGYWIILPTAPTWHPVISISLDHWRSIWVVGDFKVIWEFMMWLKGLDPDFFYAGIDALVYH